MTTSTQTICANCGKKASKDLDVRMLEPGEEYEGNQIVVRRRKHHFYTNYDGTKSAYSNPYDKVSLWDGMTYKTHGYGFGLFCTLRCAEEFARAAYRGGYRIVKMADTP